MADPISIIGLISSVMDIASSLYAYVDSVKNAKEEMRRLSQELFALKGTLDQVVQFGGDSGFSFGRQEMEAMIGLTRDTLEGLQKVLSRRKTKLGRIAHALAWPFEKGEADKFVAALERAKTWFIMVIMRDTGETTAAVHAEMRHLADIIHEDIVTRRADSMMTENEETLRWLAPADAEEEFVKATQSRVPGTCRWFFDKQFEAWADGSSQDSFLWITGKSGSGKTMLLSGIAEELRNRCSSAPDKTGCGLHYCSLDNAVSQQPANVFGSMIAQLMRLRPELIDRVRPLRKSGNGLQVIHQNSLSMSEVQTIIREALHLVDRFYILVDALNETPHHRQIVSTLDTLCKSCPNLRVLVTCTLDPDDRRTSVRKMLDYAIQRDIELYVQHRLTSEASLAPLSAKIKHRIVSTMKTSADGTFRWAQLCMDRLSNLRTGRDVLAALEDLPTTLNETYVGILLRVSTSDRKLAREALMWLAFSTQPLKLAELGEAVVLRESDRYLDADYRLADPRVLVEICNGLIQVVDKYATLAHDSIRSFLTSDWIRSSAAAEFALDRDLCHRRIMRKCLAYISFDEFAAGRVDKIVQLRDRLRRYPLLKYAVQFWPLHAGEFPLTDRDQRLILDFFATKKKQPRGGCFDSWVQFLQSSLRVDTIARTEPLYYAASFNMLPIMKLLLRPGSDVDVNQRGGRFGSAPLVIACFRGHTEAAMMLLEAGADPNAVDAGTLVNAFYYAVSRKMDPVVKKMRSLGVEEKPPPPRPGYLEYLQSTT